MGIPGKSPRSRCLRDDTRGVGAGIGLAIGLVFFVSVVAIGMVAPTTDAPADPSTESTERMADDLEQSISESNEDAASNGWRSNSISQGSNGARGQVQSLVPDTAWNNMDSNARAALSNEAGTFINRLQTYQSSQGEISQISPRGQGVQTANRVTYIGNFSNDGSNSYDIARGVSTTQDAVVQVYYNATTTDASNAFTLTASSNWEAQFYRDGDDIVVDTTNIQERFTADKVEIDFTNNEINGNSYPALDFASGASSGYDISVENGQNGYGGVDLYIDGNAMLSQEEGDLENGEHWSRTVDTVHQATFDVTYQTGSTTYTEQVSYGVEPVNTRYLLAPDGNNGNGPNRRNIRGAIPNLPPVGGGGGPGGEDPGDPGGPPGGSVSTSSSTDTGGNSFYVEIESGYIDGERSYTFKFMGDDTTASNRVPAGYDSSVDETGSDPDGYGVDESTLEYVASHTDDVEPTETLTGIDAYRATGQVAQNFGSHSEVMQPVGRIGTYDKITKQDLLPGIDSSTDTSTESDISSDPLAQQTDSSDGGFGSSSPDDGDNSGPNGGEPDDGSLDDGGSDDGSPDDGGPDDGGPDDGSPDDGSPDDGGSDDGSPDDGSPDDGGDGGIVDDAVDTATDWAEKWGMTGDDDDDQSDSGSGSSGSGSSGSGSSGSGSSGSGSSGSGGEDSGGGNNEGSDGGDLVEDTVEAVGDVFSGGDDGSGKDEGGSNEDSNSSDSSEDSDSGDDDSGGSIWGWL